MWIGPGSPSAGDKFELVNQAVIPLFLSLRGHLQGAKGKPGSWGCEEKRSQSGVGFPGEAGELC